MFKVNKRNTRVRCEIYSKLTIKTPERHQVWKFYCLAVKQECFSPIQNGCFPNLDKMDNLDQKCCHMALSKRKN